MRVQFTVWGNNEAEIVTEARKVLDTFSEGRRWNIRYSAHDGIRSGDGAITNWECDVDADHEEMEA